MIISIIGGGGKTTTLFYLANKYSNLGKAVLVSTTTKMFKHTEYDYFYDSDIKKIENYVEGLSKKDLENNFKIIGVEAERKISSPGNNILKKMSLKADILLLEADGSRGLPAKYHGDLEPVIYEETTKLIILFGLDALGKSLEKVCHRYELFSKDFNIDISSLIDIDLATLLIKRMYEKATKKNDIETLVVLNKADNKDLYIKANKLKLKLESIFGFKVVISSNLYRNIDVGR